LYSPDSKESKTNQFHLVRRKPTTGPANKGLMHRYRFCLCNYDAIHDRRCSIMAIIVYHSSGILSRHRQGGPHRRIFVLTNMAGIFFCCICLKHATRPAVSRCFDFLLQSIFGRIVA